MTDGSESKLGRVALLLILVLAAWLRGTGLFRGLDEGHAYHPDEPKQILALDNYLNGRYVVRYGTWFYDGYPYGLNHVDEWILRAVLPPAQCLADQLGSAHRARPDVTDRSALYYWARVLRLLYGLVVVLCTYSVARALTRSRGAGLLAAALVAMAPLPVAVSHFATGDIGTDLFGMLALVALCAYSARGRHPLLFLAGLCVGLAFSCKYNGALVGTAVALYVVMTNANRERWRRLVSQSLLSAGGFVVGVLVGTPALLLSYKQTVKDIRLNFVNISQFGVAQEDIARPFFARAYVGLTRNTADIVTILGWSVVLLALLGAIVAVSRYLRLRRATSGDTAVGTPEHTTLAAAVLLYPPLAMVVSLVGKLRVQSFHFSYLVAPLVIGAVYAAVMMWQQKRLRRGLAVVAVAALVIEMAAAARMEQFFWRREDVMRTIRQMPETLYRETPRAEKARVRNTFVELDRAPVFRNRQAEVFMPDAAFWIDQGVPAIPTVPHPANRHWIFANGPVYPRNERSFVVRADSRARKDIVYGRRPETMTIGLRSGAYPVAVTLKAGGQTETRVLDPDSQVRLACQPKDWKTSRSSDNAQTAFMVPLMVHAKGGAVTVTLCHSAKEAVMFDLFGGQASAPPDLPGGETAELQQRLSGMRYYGDVIETGMPMQVNHPRRHSACLPGPELWLPAGVYDFEAEIEGQTPDAAISVAVEDPGSGMLFRVPVLSEPIGQETRRVRGRFSKSFAPHACRIRITADRGAFVLKEWRLVPNAEAIAAGLAEWRATHVRPEWLAPHPVVTRPPAGRDEETSWSIGSDFQLHPAGRLAPTLQGQPLVFPVSLERVGPPRKGFRMQACFVHLVNQAGEQTHGYQAPVATALASGISGCPVTWTLRLDAEPGVYEVYTGIFHLGTNKRLDVRAPRGQRAEDDRVHLGSLTVGAPAN